MCNKKRYYVNVHYDYVCPVKVEASNEREALELAREKADEIPFECLEFFDYIDSCVTDVEDIK